MKLVSETAHRALTYVALVRRQGYRLTDKELEAFIRQPDRYGPTWDISGMAAVFDKLGAIVKTLPGETVAEWLVRLNWLAIDGNHVEITKLGSAVLRGADEQEIETELPLRIVLDPEDPLSYAKLIGRIADVGDALLVDPFFGLDQLLVILQSTSVTRVLVGPKTKTGTLAAALTSMTLPRNFTIRVSGEVHDRFIIPSAGAVDALGTSLNGVGRKFTVMATLDPPVADAIRSKHEELWRAAKPVETTAVATVTQTSGTAPSAPPNGGSTKRG
jgi:hypothetical protein